MHNKGLEIASLVAFAGWYSALVWGMVASTGGKWEKLAYVLVSHMLAGTLHVQICLSHFAREVYHGHAYNGDGDEWFRMQVGVGCGLWGVGRMAGWMRVCSDVWRARDC